MIPRGELRLVEALQQSPCLAEVGFVWHGRFTVPFEHGARRDERGRLGQTGQLARLTGSRNRVVEPPVVVGLAGARERVRRARPPFPREDATRRGTVQDQPRRPEVCTQ